MSERYEVTATSLNLRSAPRVVSTNRIAVLHQGQEVSKIDEASNPLWWLVSTQIEGVAVEGFANSRYLTPVGSAPPLPVHHTIGAVHLTNTRLTTRAGTGSRAFPLNEAGQPGRTGTTPASKVAALARIIAWLDVAHSADMREVGATPIAIFTLTITVIWQAFICRESGGSQMQSKG